MATCQFLVGHDVNTEQFFECSGDSLTRGYKWKLSKKSVRRNVKKHSSNNWDTWNKLIKDEVNAYTTEKILRYDRRG